MTNQIELYNKVALETKKTIPLRVNLFAQEIANKCKKPPIGIIFYGSQISKLDPDGLMDFYLILESLKDFQQNKLLFLGNIFLPPNIYFMKHGNSRAKVACMTLAQLQKRTQVKSLDTTIWARFSQPVYLAWVRDERSEHLLNSQICNSIYTASLWSAALGKTCGKVDDYLRDLYTNTFKTEIRVESKDRISSLIERNIKRYQEYLPIAWKDCSLPFEQKNDVFYPRIDSQRNLFLRRWRIIRLWGKIQNALRLLKAGMSFNGGADYIRWKVRRHTGISIKLSAYERKYPIIELIITVLKIVFSLIFKRSF
ncbi:hypothetical protein FAI40_00065 [Acetobacteraceae bacterium]|nr:hypothetical protein FAI40_00065 [Acetobacteraceae bacterium]